MPNPLEKIQTYYPDFTKTDRELANYFLENPRNAITNSIDSIVRDTKTSKAALSRFAQKMGYSGFSEFRYDVSRLLIGGDQKEGSDLKISFSTIIDKYSEYISGIKDTCTEEQFDHVAELFLSSNRVKIFGFNRSFNSAKQLRQRLARMGFDAEATDETTIMVDSAAFLGPQDMVIIFTTTDNTKSFAAITKELKSKGCHIVCITANPTLSFRKLCDEYIVVPRISRDSNFSFLDDQPLFMICSELLLEAIARKSNMKE